MNEAQLVEFQRLTQKHQASAQKLNTLIELYRVEACLGNSEKLAIIRNECHDTLDVMLDLCAKLNDLARI